MKIEIIKCNGRWLINNKPYNEISDEEKAFFDEFLVTMKLGFEAEKRKSK